MPKLFSSAAITKVLEWHGFLFVSQKGSHMKYTNVSSGAVVIVPANKREIPHGTFSSIVRQAKLSKADFE